MTIERYQASGRMSQATKANGFVFLAGQVADTLTASVQDQTREVLAKVDDLLAEAGTDKSKIVSVTVYMADMAEFAGMNEVYDQWVDRTNLPPRASVQAAMALPEFKVEISLVAVA
ncbi:MAG TPA: RidA family protein [Paracoccaceae bacterium]|nr:RidA family protein [Paracoccaceae bacterium]